MPTGQRSTIHTGTLVVEIIGGEVRRLEHEGAGVTEGRESHGLSHQGRFSKNVSTT